MSKELPAYRAIPKALREGHSVVTHGYESNDKSCTYEYKYYCANKRIGTQEMGIFSRTAFRLGADPDTIGDGIETYMNVKNTGLSAATQVVSTISNGISKACDYAKNLTGNILLAWKG